MTNQLSSTCLFDCYNIKINRCCTNRITNETTRVTTVQITWTRATYHFGLITYLATTHYSPMDMDASNYRTLWCDCQSGNLYLSVRFLLGFPKHIVIS